MDAVGEVLGPSLAPPRARGRTRSSRSEGWLAVTLFVLSGGCGLAYEVVWSKFLGLFLGNTVLLHSAVLGAFMGGLALGSLWIGARAARSPAPLKVYGWLELAVAGYALAFPALTDLAQWAVGMAAGAAAPGSLPLLLVKVAAAALLLLPPTLLMGATFPFLTAHLERATGRGESGANWLYFANCMGAVLGTLVTGFSLIPILGLTAAVSGVAIFNAAIGLIALAAGSRSPAPATTPDEARAPASLPSDRRVLVAIALSGATAFLYEIVWTRLFAVSLGSSTYAFTLMLAAFITGLGAGSVAANLLPWVRRHPLAAMGVAELLIGLAIAASLPFYPRLPYWSWQWRWLLRPVPETIGIYQALQYGLSFLIMAVPTFLFGLTFPTAIRAAAGPGGQGLGGIAQQAARVYGWNTLGTLAGVTLGGGILIPWLGLRGSLQAGAVVNLALGAWLWAHSTRRAGPGFALAGLGVAAVLLTSPWLPLSYTSLRANVAPPATFRDYEDIAGARTRVFYREDCGTTVAVEEVKQPGTGILERALVVDGKTDATSYGDLPTQVLLAQLPLLLKPDARGVFIIGLGSGVTAGSALTHPVTRVDCAEISPAVAAAAPHFSQANRDCLQDPRLHLILDDGKTFLASTRRRFDVIISEPTNPWISGVGNLFSQEAFRSAAAALKPGGMCVQWFHTYALNDGLVATIVRTFRSVFPHCVIFQGHEGDYLMVGSLTPLRPDWRAVEQRLRVPAVAADLSRVNIRGLAALLSRQTHTDAAAHALAEGGGLNTDDLPLLEYQAPHALYLGESGRRIRELDSRYSGDPGLWLGSYLGGRPLRRSEADSILTTLADPRTPDPALRQALLEDYARRWPRGGIAALEAARTRRSAGDRSGALTWAQEAARWGNAGAQPLVEELRRELAPRGTATFPLR